MYPNNWLLAALPAVERDAIAPHLSAVTLEAGEQLVSADKPAPWVYFPEDAVATLSLGAEKGERSSEISTIGREGMLGFPQALVDSPAGVDVTVRIGGTAQRIAAEKLRGLLAELPTLRNAFDRYAHNLVLQLARAALCERRHSIEQRLSTLILLTHDRTGGARLALTHEQLGDMLGVRRAGVTEVATKLRSQSAIDYRRGRLSVNDRRSLMQSACGCYEAISQQFDRGQGDERSA